MTSTTRIARISDLPNVASIGELLKSASVERLIQTGKRAALGARPFLFPRSDNRGLIAEATGVGFVDQYLATPGLPQLNR